MTQQWDAAYAAYRTAHDAEFAYDAQVIQPHFKGVDESDLAAWHEAAKPITPDMWAELERLADVRCDFENALMAIPSPTSMAFALKYLIAHGAKRETDCWNGILETEAERFSKTQCWDEASIIIAPSAIQSFDSVANAARACLTMVRALDEAVDHNERRNDVIILANEALKHAETCVASIEAMFEARREAA